MQGYRRPPLVVAEFRDASGEVIPYGRRWPDMPDEASYSVTVHPERFAPIADIAPVLIAALAASYLVTEAEDGSELFGNPDGIVASTRLAPEGGGAPVTIARTGFPGVRVHVGRQAEFAFPNCGCDACDEDVEEQIESLEQLLDAVLAGRFLEGEGVIGSDENGEIVGGIHAYFGEWGSSGQGVRSLMEDPRLTPWPAWIAREGQAPGSS